MASVYLWLPNLGASVAVTDTRDHGGTAVDAVNELLIRARAITVACEHGSDEPRLVINWAALSRYEVTAGAVEPANFVLETLLTNDGFGQFDVSVPGDKH